MHNGHFRICFFQVFDIDRPKKACFIFYQQLNTLPESIYPIMISSRIQNTALRQKIMSADAAAALIQNGDNVGMSGFTGAGYPKLVPAALARYIENANRSGIAFRIGVWTGA
jgi:succinyl-CoA:acetate CoA-transferase